MKRSAKGFTLIEVMIVTVILGVIVAIAYPSYTRWSLQTRRADAHRHLTMLAARQEKRLSECAAYTASFATGLNNCAAGGLASPRTSPDGHYLISIPTATSTTFTLSAAPVAGGLQLQDTPCQTITLNHLGQKGSTPGTDCW